MPLVQLAETRGSLIIVCDDTFIKQRVNRRTSMKRLSYHFHLKSKGLPSANSWMEALFTLIKLKTQR